MIRYRRGHGELTLPWGWSLQVRRGRLTGAKVTSWGAVSVPVGRKWTIALQRSDPARARSVEIELRVAP